MLFIIVRKIIAKKPVKMDEFQSYFTQFLNDLVDYNPSPAPVALSLGLYFAEGNNGLFKNNFIEFSERLQLIEIKGKTFADRLCYVASFNEIANTDLEAVFNLILKAAVDNKVSQEQLSVKIIIISDMEFDCCVGNAAVTNFENAKAKYAAYGYKLPEIVFWNTASRNQQQPVKKNDQRVCLVAGVTPRLQHSIIIGKALWILYHKYNLQSKHSVVE